MKKTVYFLFLLLIAQNALCHTEQTATQPDSVYLMCHASLYDRGRSGLMFAWSADGKQWHSVADYYRYMRSDFGPFKIMINPRIIKGDDGLWHALWQLNNTKKEYGHATSADLIHWNRQTYFKKSDPRFAHLSAYLSNPHNEKPISITLDNDTLKGYKLMVSYTLIEQLEIYANHKRFCGIKESERMEQDAVRFSKLDTVNVQVSVQADEAKSISDHLIGIFFEDLNYAADGGLYAELVQNRDFEYSPADGNKDRTWNNSYAWQLKGETASWSIQKAQPVHPNNPHYALVEIHTPGTVLMNSGYNGITVRKGEEYDFSLFTKVQNGKGGKLTVSLSDKSGKNMGSSTLRVTSSKWKKLKTVIKATDSSDEAILCLAPQKAGAYAFDMVSLFPKNTFKNRKNGLRADLAQALADLHPSFVRFPGGCLVHGDGLDNLYDWKGSIGALEARKPLPNIWRYHQTRGLGYYEYFLFCEDIGAEPLPVVSAGVSCQNSGIGSQGIHSYDFLTSHGQQQGLPLTEMPQYIQDILDLIEYANGNARTTHFGKLRAKAGHPRPFNLKYIGIGNEDLISDVFEERFTLICQAIGEAYPEITIIGTTGPNIEGTDYEEGWDLADKLHLPIVDEHSYKSPGWFIHHQDFYDLYRRDHSKVYLGEYAAHVSGRASTLEAALAEALYLTAIERNADVVTMTSYAPLLAKEEFTQWKPDLIYFNNREVKPTVSYFVQQMFSQNSGNRYLPATVTLSNHNTDVSKRIGLSVVQDSISGDCILKLVNLLPKPVNAHLTLPILGEKVITAHKTTIAGDYNDTLVRPVHSSIQVNRNVFYQMPPYSFTVIRIPSLQKL